MTAILKEDPPSLAQSAPATPPALQRVVNRCLEKNPERRFQSASDLAFESPGRLAFKNLSVTLYETFAQVSHLRFIAPFFLD
jgi:hypothetical protein